MKRKSLMIFSLMIIGLFMFTSMVPLVSADVESEARAAGEGISGFFKGLFSGLSLNFSSLNGFFNSDGFINTLFTLMVVMLVYTVLDFVGLFSGKRGIHWIVSLLVGVLFIVSLRGQSLASLLYQYEALGVIMISVIPAMILLGFTWRIQLKSLALDNPKASAVWSSRVFSFLIILGFCIFLFVRTASGDGEGAYKSVNYVIASGMLIFAFLEGFLVSLFAKKSFEAEKKIMEKNMNQLESLEKTYNQKIVRGAKALLNPITDEKTYKKVRKK